MVLGLTATLLSENDQAENAKAEREQIRPKYTCSVFFLLSHRQRPRPGTFTLTHLAFATT